MVPLNWYLVVAAALFCIGLYGALSRRNAVAVLMGIELILNAVNINLIAFWRYVTPKEVTGQIFAIFVFAVAAAEAAVGLALMIGIYRTRDTVNLEELDLLKG
ncbi:MAG: NADH-quinone oxidoreductase subunit NuoK, partial [Anaerolineae bacterium]|nr:NADH-quinone oxidoreductase subunit NuoK [Anaerolineae bacterium]MCB9143285.1 NADH-quinone oxidoreductase subunit NuoK [Anaerolineales bacterium]MCB0231759.1 NADH-quinone oxidoreductase subunit NuoK [Anaerolineae bacterium]MCB0233103.1 NADH-quinone oxidoreductase subunit NuoK [Anaerolineae bacterium]MCB0244159.1 NADH-quinone oxidoreductase subunit NuoK [Anaerolineae bacterium]